MNKFLVTIIFFLAFGTNTFSQEFRKAEPIICPIDTHTYDTFVSFRKDKALAAKGSSAQKKSNIIVNYNGFTEEARVAFQYAVDIWSSLLQSPVDIIVNANFSDLGEGVLGSAGPTNFVRDFEGAPKPGTFYPIPLAEKLAGYSLNNSTSADINANFSSTFNFYFGLDGQPGASSFDFVSIVLHELGHGLGFTGAVSYNEEASPAVASWDIGTTEQPSIYTSFAQLGNGTLITDLPSVSTEVAQAFTSNNLFFNGAVAKASLGANPRLYAPTSWNGGSSYSHLDEATYAAGNPNSLMSPQFGRGEAIHDPGVSLDIFADMGWVHTYLKHENSNKISSNITDPFLITLAVESDTTFSAFAPVLHYTFSDFSNEVTVDMLPSGNGFTAEIPNPGNNNVIKYYIDGIVDILNREYTSPAVAPEDFYEINIYNAGLKTLPYLSSNGGNFETNEADFIGLPLNGSTNLWERGTPSNRLNFSPSGSNVWKTDLDGNISRPDQNNSSALLSPIFDFSNELLDHKISFKFSMENAFTEEFGLFSSGPFGFNIEYTLNNGANWTLLGEKGDKKGTNWYNVDDEDNFVFPSSAQSGWIKQTIEVTGSDTTFIAETATYNVSFLTGNPQVQFRIVFHVSRDFNNAGYGVDGLLIDDFEVLTTNPTAEFIANSANIVFSGNEVNFEYISTGATAYLWDFGDGTTSTLENPVHTYSQGGTYNVSLTIQSAAGEKTLLKENFINVVPSYIDSYSLADGGDLESGATDFNILNVSGTGFEKGVSSISGKNGTASGNQAIVTGITDATYQNDSEAYIYTPAFNLSTIGLYELSFETNYSFEDNWDGFIVEYSVDRGESWLKLKDQVDEGWYNQISDPLSVFGVSVPIFSGNTSGAFERKSADISFLQGVGNVAFRIKFLTDAAVVDAGMAFDNFEISYSEPLPAIPDFTASILGACVEEDVNFTNTSLGSIASVSWDFGPDASPRTSESLNPKGIKFSTSGLKDIKLTVTDLYGEEFMLSKTEFIQVGATHSPTYTAGERNEDFSRLLTSSPGDAYQWFYKGDTISGANEMTFLAIESGDYTVAVRINGCVRESATENIVTASKSALANSFKVYPNPINEQQLINFTFSNDVMGSYEVSIFDTKGRLMFSNQYKKNAQTINNSIEVNEFRNGMYILRIKIGTDMTQKKFLIKK